MGIIFNIVKDYTFLFKGGKFMDNFEKVEGEKLGEVAGGRPDVLRVEKHKCIKCGRVFWTNLRKHDRNPYCYTCRDKGEVGKTKSEIEKDEKVISNPILPETKN